MSLDTVLVNRWYPQFDIHTHEDTIPVLEIGDLWAPPISQKKFHTRYFGRKEQLEFSQLGSPIQLQTNNITPVSLDLQTFHAFTGETKIVDAWNTDIQRLMKQTDAEKRGELKIGVELPSAMESIVGEGGAGLKVSGYRRILFSGRSQWTDATSVSSVRQNKFPSLTMDQQSRFTIEGTVGSKVSVKVDQDSQRQTDLENRIQIRYKGDEDDVLQTVEAGNTNLSLPNTRYVGYSQRIQGLFGLKATAQLGPLDFTMITSQEKGNTVRNRFTAGATSEQISYKRDYQYARFRFFDIGRIGEESLLEPGDKVVRFDLYEQISSTDVTRGVDGVAYSDVRDPNRSNVPSPINGRFALMEGDGTDWVLVRDDASRKYPYLKFINAQTRIENKAIAYYMEIDRNGTTITVGKNGAPIELQLLKTSNPSPNDPFWDAEWKNVYDLGFRNIDYDQLTLDIYKGQPGDEANPANLNHQGGVPYIQILGLDRQNVSGQAVADARIDNSPAILDLVAGLLIFPDQRPFDTDVGYSLTSSQTTLDKRVPSIYETDNYTELQQKTTYFFRLVSKSRSTTVSLQQVNILPESEVITFNGRRLIKGSDYSIDYGIGQVVFLRDEFLDPTGDLTIDYEYAPFLTAEKKTLFGMRSEYQPGDNFRTGATFLYKGSKATDRPAQLGQEPFRDIVLDYDVFWKSTPGIMTNLVDALPLVKTDVRSSLTFEGEIARSMPNPNTKGEVFVDDFESSRQAYSLGILRESWSIASPPVLEFDQSRTHPARGSYDPSFNWYNPYTQFRITDVYDREIDKQSNDQMHVLILRFTPEKSRLFDSVGGDPRAVWGGIMRGLPRGVWDQTRAQLIEIRMGVRSIDSLGRPSDISKLGVLHIDLGRIDEDVNQNGVYDTEDKDRSGTLSEDEDTGLDLLADPEEEGYDPVTNPDPAGDDWAFDNKDPNNVDRINGTEGNASDYLLGRADSEDLGGPSEFDRDNSYYEFAIDLANPGDALVQGSDKVSQEVSGLTWKTFRIPLWDSRLYDAIMPSGTPPDSNDIEYVRLWIDNAGQKMEVYIAGLDIIQNRWEGAYAEGTDVLPPGGGGDHEFNKLLDVRAPSASVTRLADPAFRVEVKNTETDNTYEPPPGVSGYRDPTTNVREKEQSLSLVYDNFLYGDTGRAILSSVVTHDYTGYRFLRMFVHGDDNADGNTEVYLRLGQNENTYYEYRNAILPGWDANNIDIDFNELTAFKQLVTSAFAERGITLVDTFDVESHFGIKGQPSLSRVGYLEIGLIRAGAFSDPAHSSEVWCDELRLTDVRNDAGTAGRMAVTAQFADVMGFSALVDGQNYAFRTLNDGRTGSVINNPTRTNVDMRGNVNLQKFGLDGTGLRLPISASYSRSVSTPKLLTGSDVVLTDSLQKEEQTVLVRDGFSMSSISWTPPGNNWLLKSTIGGLAGGFSLSRSRRSSPTVPGDTTIGYSANASYRLNFGKRLTFPPLYWTRYLLFPQRIWRTPFSILPNSFDARGNVNRTKSVNVNSNDLRTENYVRNFDGSAGVSTNPIPALRLTYNMTTRRDISAQTPSERVVLSVDPSKFKLGREQLYNQKFSADYRPYLLSFFSPSFGYSSDFNDRIDDLLGDHDVAVNRRLSVSNTFDLQKFWSALGANSSGPARRPRTSSPRPKDTQKKSGQADEDATKKEEAADKQQSEGGGFDPLSPWRGLMKGISFLTTPLDPISVTLSQTDSDKRNNLASRPSMRYQFGLAIDTVDVGTVAGANSPGQINEQTQNRSISMKNNIRIGRILTVSNGYGYAEGWRQQPDALRNRSTSESFPNLSTGLGQLERFPPLSWIFSNASAKTGYARKKDNSFIGSDLQKSSTTEGFSPLLNITGTTAKGIRLTFSADNSSTLTEGQSTNPTKRTTGSYRIAFDYSFRSPYGIPLPFLRGIKLKSQMSISITITQRNAETLIDKGDGFEHQSSSSEFSVAPRANYSFSSRVKGGVTAQWTDSSDDTGGAPRKSHIRELGFWAEFSF